MTDFQSIGPSYRDSVPLRSRHPINGSPTLAFMRKRERSEFGERLLLARERAELTQPQLAQAVGMSQSTLAEAENVGSKSQFTVRIALRCGVSPLWLESGEGPMLPAAVWPFRRVTLSRVLALSETDRDFVEGELNAAIRQCEQRSVPVVGTITHEASQDLDFHRDTDKKTSTAKKTLATQQVGPGSPSGSRESGKVPKSRGRRSA